MIAVLLALTGCWGPGSKSRQVADELCRWGQLEELTPDVLPPTVELAKLVRELDLRYASGEPPAGPSTENPFLALHQTVGMVVDDPARALAEVQAARSVCEVTVTFEGETAKAHVSRTLARPLDGADAFLRAGELQRLPTHELRVAEIHRWFDATPETRTTEYDLKVERTATGWIANLGLPEAALATAEAELATVNETIAKAEADAAELAKVVVIDARWFKRASKRSSATRVDITVRNDLPVRVTRVDFHGTLTTPDREEPWVDEELSYTVRGKMEPGDQETFTFVSRLPPKWRVNAPEDAQLAVKVIRMAGGPTGEVMYNLDGWEAAVGRKEVLVEEIARLKSTYGL
jgi:hypothetical protein